MIRPIQHVLLGQGGPGEPDVPTLENGIFFAATYDESDVDEVLSWERQGSGPHITEKGMVGDGYGARYKAESGIPSWLAPASAPLTVQATIAGGMFRSSYLNGYDTILHIDSASSTKAKIKIVVGANASDSADYHWLGGQLQARANSSGNDILFDLPRPMWRFQGIYPELTRNGFEARPQGICFVDEDTVLVSAHYENEFTVIHRIRIQDMAVTGSFEMGYSPSHVGAITRRADGTIWVTENQTRVLHEIDVNQSVASGAAVINKSYDYSATQSAASISWETIGGNEYMLVAEYLTTPSTPYLYLIPASEVTDGGVFDLSDRVVRFEIKNRTQGIRMRDGTLYMTSNMNAPDIRYQGHVYSVDIEDAVLNLSDGDPLPVLKEWMGASEYVEDLDFNPGNGDVWMVTEGLTSVGDRDEWMSIWSARLGDEPAENTYTIRYDGNVNYGINVNNQPFGSFVLNNPDTDVDCISIGGGPADSAGQDEGFFFGTIRNVLIQEAALGEGQYDLALNGEYEDGVLQMYEITLTNPGAEAGDTSGWTDENGGMAVREANPLPHSGNYYFSGGANPFTRSSQRVNLETTTGLSGSEIDASPMWASVRWWQASYSNADNDTAGLGIRLLDGSETNIAESIGPLLNLNLPQTWFPRNHPVTILQGSREADLLYDSVRFDGTNLDGYVDDITLTIYRQ